MPDVTAEQAGGAAVWFTSQAGITALVLAIFCIILVAAFVWLFRRCEKRFDMLNAAWVSAVEGMEKRWGARIDQIRGDTKDAFGQNADIADKVVEALHSVKLEVARMSGRRDN